MKHKFSLILASLLAVIMAFFPIITISNVQAGSLNGTTPATTIVSVDATFINDFDCPFPLVEQVTGAYRDTFHFDQDGVLVREFLSPQFQGALTVRWTNPETGVSLESHEASSITIYYSPDGSFKKLTNQGLTFMVTVPGEGKPLLTDVGRLVIERGKGITFEAGVHQELNGDTGRFCNYFAEAR